MEVEHLIKMANQISDFFRAQPDHNEAVKGTAQHLKSFWDPRMRREIIAYFNQTGGRELKPIAREAVAMLDAESRPPSPSQ